MGASLDRVDDFLRTIDCAKGLDEVFWSLKTQTEALGFERFAYWLMWTPDGRRLPLYINSYPQEWIKHYTNENFGSDDLAMRYAGEKISPYSWKEVTDHYQPTKRQRLVFSEGAEAGLCAGATVPINGPGLARAVFSVSNNEGSLQFDQLFLEVRHTLHLIATYAHEKILELDLHTQKSSNVRLSAREIEVLTWTARGKTRWEISQILTISEETVKTHLENCCRRLKCQNKTHATALALINGLILP